MRWYVCLFVHALTGKWLELSTPNLVNIYSIAVARHALTLRSKGQVLTVASDVCCCCWRESACQYDCLCFLVLNWTIFVIAREQCNTTHGGHTAWARVPPFLPFYLPCQVTSSSFALSYFFPFLIRFTYSLLSIPSLSSRSVTTPFPGRRRRSNLGLVCSIHFVFSVKILYCLVNIYSGVLLYFV